MLRKEIGSLNEKTLNESIKLRAFEQKVLNLEKKICLLNIVNKFEEVLQLYNLNRTHQIAKVNMKRNHEDEISGLKKENQGQKNYLNRCKSTFIVQVEEIFDLTILILMIMIALNVNILICLIVLHLISSTEISWFRKNEWEEG